MRLLKRKKSIFVNLTVLFLALCLSIASAEIFIRIFFATPDESRWIGAEKKFYEYDSLLGWKKIPNLNTTRVTAGKPPVVYKINSKSIRGPEYPYNKSDNEYRILILGDSFADGFMVEFHELFSEILKKKLNDMNKNKYFEVINSGTSGWSTDQELLFFQTEGKKYKPDLTILMFYENDITYNNRPKDWGMYYKPLFKLKNGELILTNVPVPKPDIFIIHDHLEPKERSLFKRLRGWLNMNSYLYKLVKERIKNTYKLRKLATQAHMIEKTEDEDVFFPAEYRVWEKNYNETVRDAWKITEAMIVKLREEAASVGSELIVFYIPFEGSIYLEQWERLKRKYNLSDSDWSVELPGIILEDICKRNNIDFINPTQQFRDQARLLEEKNKRLYDPLDHHWNVEGNYLAGKILFEYIQSKYLAKQAVPISSK